MDKLDASTLNLGDKAVQKRLAAQWGYVEKDGVISAINALIETGCIVNDAKAVGGNVNVTVPMSILHNLASSQLEHVPSSPFVHSYLKCNSCHFELRHISKDCVEDDAKNFKHSPTCPAEWARATLRNIRWK